MEKVTVVGVVESPPFDYHDIEEDRTYRMVRLRLKEPLAGNTQAREVFLVAPDTWKPEVNVPYRITGMLRLRQWVTPSGKTPRAPVYELSRIEHVEPWIAG
jgi:hypothetical protein